MGKRQFDDARGLDGYSAEWSGARPDAYEAVFTALAHPARRRILMTVHFNGCLSRESVHDAPGGGIVVRPWGERSFYAEDPWQNPLGFVEEGTVYAG